MIKVLTLVKLLASITAFPIVRNNLGGMALPMTYETLVMLLALKT